MGSPADITVTELVARDERGGFVAQLWLDDRDAHGRVVLMTWDAVWTCCWPRRGRGGSESLGRWLSSCYESYVAQKLDADESFDLDATIGRAKRVVCDDRRDGSLDSDDARALFDEAGAIHDERSAVAWFREYIGRTNYPDAWERRVVQTTIHPEFRRAWALLVPALRELP